MQSLSAAIESAVHRPTATSLKEIGKKKARSCVPVRKGKNSPYRVHLAGPRDDVTLMNGVVMAMVNRHDESDWLVLAGRPRRQ